MYQLIRNSGGNLDGIQQRKQGELEYLVFPSGVTLATPELTDEVDEDLPIWRD